VPATRGNNDGTEGVDGTDVVDGTHVVDGTDVTDGTDDRTVLKRKAARFGAAVLSNHKKPWPILRPIGPGAAALQFHPSPWCQNRFPGSQQQRSQDSLRSYCGTDDS